MHNKFLSLLAAAMLTLSAAGCGNSAPETKPVQATTAATVQIQSVETTAPTFSPITLVDDANCTVTIAGIEPNALFGYTLKVFLENKTDKELMYSLDGVSVNGYMCDPLWATTVSAGKKANSEISFMDSDFEENGIIDVTDITFTLNVYDSNDWLTDNFVAQEFTINP